MRADDGPALQPFKFRCAEPQGLAQNLPIVLSERRPGTGERRRHAIQAVRRQGHHVPTDEWTLQPLPETGFSQLRIVL
jgi:hypothetical protein